MAEDIDPLVLDLVEWAVSAPRTHADLMETWRTSCPRLTVWEDAVDQGYVTRGFEPGRGAVVVVTQTGRRCLAAARGATKRAKASARSQTADTRI